ncbi:MAG TPA: HipA family kinase [Conexibacter sp.]|nr:HipA family kinase [Conexibacter sp.]
MPEPLRSVAATRYVCALREGGSLPGLVEADDDGLYVTKLRGAGQGERALVAEVLAGELARALGLPVPELVVVEIAPELAAAEPDPEIQELISASAGTNAGMDFLPGALPFLPAAGVPPDPAFAADVVWFDALVTNVDRTHRNPNLLVWHGRTWLIDHGAAFFRQHGTRPLRETAGEAVPQLADHVLLPFAAPLAEADERLATRATAAVDGAAALVPDVWLGEDPAARRDDLATFLHARLSAPRDFVEEADRARG